MSLNSVTKKPSNSDKSEFDELFFRIEGSTKGAKALFVADGETLRASFHPDGQPVNGGLKDFTNTES